MASPESNGPIWLREPAARPAGLTREAILRAAIALADEHGIEAVSIRRVAAELGARPMSLYSQIERKDDLFDLMFDAVVGESLLASVPADWRGALRAIAEATRATFLRHPWIFGAQGVRSGIGPNTVRHVEQSLAALASLEIDVTARRRMLTAVDMYTVGHATHEAVEHQTRRRDGMSEAAWERSANAYIERLVATGEFPQIAAFGTPIFHDTDLDESFTQGLDWLLDGIAASLARRS